MLDIHAHLYWKSFDADREAVIRRAREAGVEKIICVGTEPKDNPLAVEVAEKYEDVYASVGIHPHFFNEFVERKQNDGVIPTEAEESRDPSTKLGMTDLGGWVNDLRELAKHPKVVAIGECGLEYFSHPARNAAPARNAERIAAGGHSVAGGDPAVTISAEQKERQKKGFLMQIELAQELKLPLIVHCRDAYEDMLEILQATSYKLPAIMHCYMGDTEVTKKFLEIPNVYFSFTGNITYPTKKEVRGTRNDLQETVKMIPLERLFVETDCPFLAPQPERGRRNEPAFVRHTFDKVCELKNVEKEALRETLVTNYGRVFER